LQATRELLVLRALALLACKAAQGYRELLELVLKDYKAQRAYKAAQEPERKGYKARLELVFKAQLVLVQLGWMVLQDYKEPLACLEPLA